MEEEDEDKQQLAEGEKRDSWSRLRRDMNGFLKANLGDMTENEWNYLRHYFPNHTIVHYFTPGSSNRPEPLPSVLRNPPSPRARACVRTKARPVC